MDSGNSISLNLVSSVACISVRSLLSSSAISNRSSERISSRFFSKLAVNSARASLISRNTFFLYSFRACISC